MAGFNFELGRSNNMVAAEERGMVTIGRWARKYHVTAKAAKIVMDPDEAHHTGTGRPGKSRLTYVIERDTVPTDAQLVKMRAIDAGETITKTDCMVRWLEFEHVIGRFGKHLGRRPVEHAVSDATVVFDAANRVALVNGRDASHWCGLIVLEADGTLLSAERVNGFYESVDSISARLCSAKAVLA